MKQFTLSRLSLLLLLLMVTSISCQKNQVSKSTTTPPDHKTLAITTPGNSNNPYDNAGYWHNNALDYLKANLTTGTTAEELEDMLRYYIANYPSAPYTHPDNEDLEEFMNDVKNGEVTFDQSSFEGINAWNYYKDLLDEIVGEEYAEAEYDDYWTIITDWEDDVMNDLTVSQSDKVVLLSYGSVLRWSGYYWINQDMEEWPNPIFDHSTARPWWMVALCDGLGALAGSSAGPGGAVLVGYWASLGAAVAVSGGLSGIDVIDGIFP